MLKIIRHQALYKDPAGFIENILQNQSPKTGGSKLVFLFPTQAVMEYWEEQLLLAFGSWGGARFLLFDGLVREILNETRPQMIDLSPGRGALLLRLLAEELSADARLSYLTTAVSSPRLYSSLRKEILILKRARIEPRTFTGLVTDGSPALQDLSLLYDHYQKYMEEHNLADAEEKIRLATMDAPKSTWLQQLDHLLVFGFTDFTRQQTELLHTISSIVKVTLVFDHSMTGRKGLSPPAFTGYEVLEEEVIPAPAKPTAHLLGALQATVWRKNSAALSLPPDASMRLIKAKGGWRREVAHLADELKRVISANANLSPEQIGFVTPYPLSTVYQILIASGLSVTTKLSAPISTEPVARALLQPFKVVLTDFSWAEMINYLRLGGINIVQAFYTFVPPATLSGWQTKLSTTFDQRPEIAEHITSLLKLVGNIPPEGTFEDYLTVCLQWISHPLLRNGLLPDRLTSEPYLQARYLQTALLSKIRRMLNNTHASLFRLAQRKMTCNDFYLILQSLLEAERIQLPTSWENGIRLLSPSEVRGVNFKVTVFAGLNEGFFPRIDPEGWLLRGEEIKRSPVAVSIPNNLDKLAMERLLFFYLINSAQEQLILSYCETDQEGEPVNPSSFLEDLLTLYPSLKESITVANSGEPFFKPVPSKGKLRTEIADKIAYEHGRRQGKHTESRGLQEKEREVLKSKFTVKPMSVSALEEYAACPFGFFCHWLLKLESMEEPEFLPSRLIEGDRYHAILRQFFGRHQGEVLSRRLLPQYLEEIRVLVTDNYSLGDESVPLIHRNFLTLGREKFYLRLEKVIKEEVAWAEQTAGRFTAKYLELGFGGIKKDADPASTAQPLVLTAGLDNGSWPPLRLWGKMDRVDTDREGRFIIYDYKSGNPPQLKAIKEGQLLQLPLYMLAVSRLFLPAGEPVGAAYYSLKQVDRRRGIWRKEALNFGLKIHGALTEDKWDTLVEHSIQKALSYYRGILQGDFSFAPPEECRSYCEFRKICRRARWGREFENEVK